MSETNHVTIIGTRAAGMLAAIAVTREGAVVELWEQNEKPGKGLFITSKGRCNMTNACNMEELLGFAVSSSKFLYSNFCSFTNQDMMNLSEQARLRLKAERGNRVFPQSDKSSDVISALSALLGQAGTGVRPNQKAGRLAVEEGVCRGVRCGDRIQTADRAIIATEGLSYPITDSTGDGPKRVTGDDHRLTGLSPILIPSEVKETETVEKLRGSSLKNIEAAVYDRKEGLYRGLREMLFTHFGAGGPVLLSTSSLCAETIRKRPLRLVIDPEPALSWEQLDERIPGGFSDNRNKQSKGALGHLYPSKLIPVIIDRSSVDLDKEVNEITRKERRGLVETTEALEFTLTDLRGYKEAIVTQGGISVKDVNPSTMGSKKIQGLHSAREILDLDVMVGSLNLQITQSTG